MPNNVKHFAVHADDVERARKFYESVLGWNFTPWGPPNFYLIKTGTDDDPGVQGALQGRRDIVPGKTMFGFECTIGVDSIDDTIAAVDARRSGVFPTVPGDGFTLQLRERCLRR